MDEGWIKLHRKIRAKGYYKHSQYVHLWIHLLLSANRKAEEFMWNGGTFMVKPGQLITGRKKLSFDTGIPHTTIDRILETLESGQEIGQQKTTKYRLITITNWNKYQMSGSETGSKRATDGHQTGTNKKVNTSKNKDITLAVPSTAVHNSLGAEIIKSFEGVDPKNKTYYGNKTQRAACDFLLEEYGLEAVLKRITVLHQTNRVPYFPTITTPVQLRDKWVQLQDAVDRKRSEATPKKTIVI